MNKRNWRRPSSRGMVLAVLGVVTLGVAVLSMAVSYQILEPPFGKWAVPTVGALDALWVVFQATEILSCNNRRRAGRVRWAGLALTLVNAAIPTVDLALRLKSTDTGFDLAVVIAPVAIVAAKGAWWIALPALGRRVSDKTRRTIATRRQQVADQLEEMEAEAADRIELLSLATDLNERVSEAETAYRLSVLKTQQTMTENLHEQAETTAATIAENCPLRSPCPNSAPSSPARPPCPAHRCRAVTPSARRSAPCRTHPARQPAHPPSRPPAHRPTRRHTPSRSRTSRPSRACRFRSPASN